MAASWFSSFWHNRWIVLVASSWVQACTGLGVMYATFSPAIKSSLGYNQKQISRLGVAKDFGHAAEIIAGCLSQVLSTRKLLFLGGSQFLLGYGLLWLIVVNILRHPPFWVIFLLIFISGNAPRYLDMAAVLSCLPSFLDSRGSVLGVLEAFKGLSGAIFSQTYRTFFSPNRSAALLMVALGPALVAFAMTPIVRPVGKVRTEDKRFESCMYIVLYSICFLIAGYMVIVLFLQGDIPVGDYRAILLCSGLFTLILSPFVVSLISILVLSRNEVKESYISIESGLCEALLQGSNDQRAGELCRTDEIEDDNPASAILAAEQPVIIVPPGKKDQERVVSQFGRELTFTQTLKTVEFWLLFFALYCGVGSGSTALDNLAQMAQAQGYQNTNTFVSIFSISSYIGHLIGGYISELLMRNFIPRPVSLIVVEGVMMLAQFLFAMASPGLLYMATICLGLSYGSFSSINPAISSEIFGLKSFGPTFGLLALAAPLSSTVLAGFVAGAIYDAEAAKQQSSDCTGQVCFYLTCWIMVGLCAVGMILSAVLSWGVRDIYKILAYTVLTEPSKVKV